MFGYCMLAGATRDALASENPNKNNLLAAGASWGLFPVMIASQSINVRPPALTCPLVAFLIFLDLNPTCDALCLHSSVLQAGDDGIKPWLAATNTILCLAVGGTLVKHALDMDKKE